MKQFIAYYILIKSKLRLLKPTQLLTLGFLSYVFLGTFFLSLPFSQKTEIKFIDNLFNVVSAVSTTGLTTISVSDSYSRLGEFILMILFQLGGIGYMTISSFIIIASGKRLSHTREQILTSEYTLPKGFTIRDFVFKIFIFTVIIETMGSFMLYLEFRSAGVNDPLWSSIFHCISAFATAGFSLNNNSLENFKTSPLVNFTISILCYLGALGFIVIADFWFAVRSKDYKITFTSKIILWVTFVILFIEAPLFLLIEPSIASYTLWEKIQISLFQIMTSSTTAGFNTVSIGGLHSASLTLILFAMIIGASPSGTGGGIKTTTFTALLAVTISMLKGQTYISFFKNRVPLVRLFTAVSSVTIYLFVLTLGLFALTLTDQQDFLKLVFESASALGTVGLSMGITGDLSNLGKLILTLLMFLGRVGPLTIGLAILYNPLEHDRIKDADLAV